MFRTILSAFLVLCAGSAALPALAGGVTPGLVSVELLPVQTAPDGSRMTAVHLVLEPGWKTYWRTPGDTGVPPHFDWTGSTNMADARPVWPRPEVIVSGGERTLGYHDELVLPVRITSARADAPVDLKLALDFGLCRDICVPAHVTLNASSSDAAPDPRIAAALARVPVPASGLECELSDIADGVQVTAHVAAPARPGETAALELAQDDVWKFAQPQMSRDGDLLTAAADFVAPTGKPFALNTGKLRLTLIHDGGAVEYQGCADG